MSVNHRIIGFKDLQDLQDLLDLTKRRTSNQRCGFLTWPMRTQYSVTAATSHRPDFNKLILLDGATFGVVTANTKQYM